MKTTELKSVDLNFITKNLALFSFEVHQLTEFIFVKDRLYALNLRRHLYKIFNYTSKTYSHLDKVYVSYETYFFYTYKLGKVL